VLISIHYKTVTGRLLEKLTHIKLGKVDCDAEPELCHEQGVRSYPTIRLYPLGSRGSSRYTPYTQYHRLVQPYTQYHRLVPPYTQYHRLVPRYTQYHRLVPPYTQYHRLVPRFTQYHRLVQPYRTRSRLRR
jgi:hypothetical protein